MMMRSFGLLAAAVGLGPVPRPVLSAPPVVPVEQSSDELRIKRVVSDATRGWDQFDIAAATAEYADDAAWFNAFGRERHGKAAIQELVGRVLSSPGFRAGKKGALEFDLIEFLRPDLALVHTTQETLGQKQLGGADLGPRRTHIFRLMQKTGSEWRTRVWIASDQQSGGTLPAEVPK